MPGMLRNRTRRAITLNLTTAVAPVRHVFSRVNEGADGSTKVSGRRLILPESITILAGETSKLLPDGVRQCPEVAAALTRRDVLWVDAPTPAAEEKTVSLKRPKVIREELEAEPEQKAEPRPRSRRG